MDDELSIRQVTDYLFKYLLSKRAEAYSKISGIGTVNQALNLLLSDKPQIAYSYSSEMKRTTYKPFFLQIINIDPKMSDSEYTKKLQVIYSDLVNKINEEEDNPHIDNAEIKKMFGLLAKGQVNLIQAIQPNVQQQKSKIVPPPPPPQSNFKYEPKKQQIKKVQPKVQPKKDQAPKSDKKVEQKKEQPKKQEPKKSQVLSQKKPEQKSKVSQQESKPQFIIKSNELKSSEVSVTVRFFNLTFDYDYKYKTYSVKEYMKKFIKQYLKNNVVNVKRKSNELRILDEISYVKSPDAGNYYFDPFCGAVQILIKRNGNKQFQTDFKIMGGDIDIKECPISKPQQWNKAFLKLSPKNSVSDLCAYIGQKRQLQKEKIEKLAEALRKIGGANIIQDLFNWSVNQYEQLKIMTTIIYEIKQVIDMIKDCNKTGTQKSHSEKKRQCLRKGNSHKILRYLVYKLEDMAGAKKLPWLNLDNVRESIKIVRTQIHNQQLLDQLKLYFQQFALDPKDNPIPFSRGMVLYGPPGTGKTVLTQAMPDIMGFHLIEKGLSAADFMKSLQGESSRMIRDLVNRGNQSPYLLCSVGIDEVDGLVPDRKDKDEKNKGEGISMLLSVIGGNKDVPNLVYMTSTNYLKKIDEAIRRRLSGQFQVGRPNPEARQKIVKSKVKYLEKKPQLLQLLIKITTNFTGAALGGVSNTLNQILRTKQMEGKAQELNDDQILKTAALMARQFSITLGVYTLPQIYSSQVKKKNVLSKRFLSRVTNNFVIVQKIGNQLFKLSFANVISRYIGGKLDDHVQTEEEDLDLSGLVESNSVTFFKKYLIDTYQQKNIKFFQKIKQTTRLIADIPKIIESLPKNSKNPSLIFFQVAQQKQKDFAAVVRQILKKKGKRDIHIILFLNQFHIRETIYQNLYGKLTNNKMKINYSGRVFVELNNQARFAFQLKSSVENQSKIAFKLFLKSQQSNTSKDVIPELVSFFTKQQVSYILLLDYQLLLQNDAFEEKKMLEIMQEKMTEAKNYQRVAVIINVDSLITMSQNASDSSFGRSMSYSVVNHNMYQILLNYMSQFAMVQDKYSKWISIVAKNQQIVKKVKKDLNWPPYPQEEKKQKEQQELDKERLCKRCNAWFTQRKNKQERTCMQHPGKIIDMLTGEFQQVSNPEELRANLFKRQKKKQKQQKKDRDQDRYLYTCCLKNLTQQGHKAYFHITSDQFENPEEDQVFRQRIERQEQWDAMKQKLTE